VHPPVFAGEAAAQRTTLVGVTLKGQIVANQLGGQPLARVRVSAGGANPTESRDDGNFTLIFPNKEPGEVVQVTVSKPGYVAVNYIQLRVVLSKTTDPELLIVLMCKESEREEWARRFYRLKSLDAVQDAYEKRLKELEQTQSATAATVAKLREERDQAKAAAENAAEELAKLKPGETSALYAEAMSSFLKGNVEEALTILDEEKLRSSAEAASRNKAEAEMALAETVQAYLLRARILTTQFRFDEAQETYTVTLESAPDSFQANFAYANFSQNLRRYDQAARGYKKSLDLARRGGNQTDVASTLNNFGILDSAQNRMEEARQAYEEALKIRRQLAQQNPETYLADVATTLNNLGTLNGVQYRMEEAHQAFEEALKIRRQLAKQDPETYLPYLASTLDNLGNLDSSQNRMEEARQEHEEALRIYRQLAKQNPETYLPDVATTLDNLGNLDAVQNRMEDARLTYEETLEIHRQLAKQNPETYLPGVGATLNNLGVLDRAQNRMEEARQAHEEALKIYRQFAEQNPETYLPEVANTLNNLGVLDRAQNRMEEARQAYEEALSIYEKFAARNPERYGGDAALVRILLEQLKNETSPAGAP
jgi:tetratricopeptide (TPR) repeat protein